MHPRGIGLVLAACLTLLAGQLKHEVALAASREKANPGDQAPSDRHGDPLPPGALDRLGTYRMRQGGNIHSVAFAPDGKTVASAGCGGPIRLWDLATGKELQQITGHKDILRSVTFSADGKTLVAAGLFTDALYFWDARTGQYLRHVGKLPRGREMLDGSESNEVGCLTFSPDSKTLVHARGEVRFHDAPTGQERARLNPYQPDPWFICAAFSPDGKRLATGDYEKNVCLWEPGGKHLLTLTGHKAAVLCLTFSPDGKLLASASEDGELRLWDAAADKFLRLFRRHSSPVQAILFTADGKHLIAGSSDRVSLSDVTSGAEVRQFSEHNGNVVSLALSPDGRMLAGAGGYNSTVRLWEVATGKPVLSFDGHRDWIRTLAFRNDGAVLASGGSDGVLLWDVKAARVIRRIGGEKMPAYALAWRPDMRCLACASRGEGPRLLEASTGKELRRFPGPKDDDANRVVWAPDGSFLASRHDKGLIRLWNPATGKLIRVFGDKLGQYQSPAFCVISPDGSLLAIGGPNGTTQLWGTADGKLVRVLGEKGSSGHSAAFSPDGKILAVGDHTVHLFDVETGKALGQLKGHNPWIHTLAFSPDGKQLASAGGDEEIRIWEMATGQERQRFVGHRGGYFRIQALAFSPDGQILVSAGQDTTILLWDVFGRATGRKPPEVERAASLKVSWEDLAQTDAPRAYEAIRRLIRTPEQTVPFLRGTLRPVPRPDPRRLAQLVQELDSDSFAVREKATQELGKLQDAAAPALKEALRGRPSGEVQRRAQELLENLEGLSAQQLQAFRALEALEHMGGSEARRLLAELAEGSPGARLTREAKSALQRLTRLPAPAAP